MLLLPEQKARYNREEGKQFGLGRKRVQEHTEPCWETWDDTSRVKLTGICCHSKFSFYDATISFLVETEQSNSYVLKKKKIYTAKVELVFDVPLPSLET